MHVLLFGFYTTVSKPNLALDMRINREFGAAIFVFLVGAAGASFEAFMNRKKRFPLAGITTGTTLVALGRPHATSAAAASVALCP